MVADLPRPRARARRRREQGYGLIEVLMALLLFSVGVLGMVALQARASQFSTMAEDRSRAALLANDLTSVMWTEGTTSISAAAYAAWQAKVADATDGGLPEGEGTVSEPDADGVVTISITWKAPARVHDDDQSQYVTKVVLP